MEATRKSYLSVENLNVSYKQNHVLEDISFQVERGQFVCVIGPNGGGKSTLLKALVGLLPIRSGKVYKDARKIGYVPQQLRIDAAVPLRVDEFLSLKLSKSRIWFGPGQTRMAAKKKLEEIGAAHLVAERDQHLGDARHAGATDADEMQAPDLVLHRANSRQRSATTRAASGLPSARAFCAMRKSAGRSSERTSSARRSALRSRCWMRTAAPCSARKRAFAVW